MPRWSQAKLVAARVLVVGAGALGNEVLKNLALLGAGTIYICDYDRIERSNLCKSLLFNAENCGEYKAQVAAQRLALINPEIRIVAITANIDSQVGLGLFAEADLVFGCVDNRLARQSISRHCFQTGTPYIDGGLHDYDGEVCVLLPPDDPCYDCILPESARSELAVRLSCGLISATAEEQGIIAVSPLTSAIIAAVQVQEGMKILQGLPVIHGQRLHYAGYTGMFTPIKLARQPECPRHDSALVYQEVPITSKETFQQLRQRLKISQPIGLPRDYVYAIQCRYCQSQQTIWLASHELTTSSLTCRRCGALCSCQFTHWICAEDDRNRQPIRELLPPQEIIHIYEQRLETFRYFFAAGMTTDCEIERDSCFFIPPIAHESAISKT